MSWGRFYEALRIHKYLFTNTAKLWPNFLYRENNANIGQMAIICGETVLVELAPEYQHLSLRLLAYKNDRLIQLAMLGRGIYLRLTSYCLIFDHWSQSTFNNYDST